MIPSFFLYYNNIRKQIEWYRTVTVTIILAYERWDIFWQNPMSILLQHKRYNNKIILTLKRFEWIYQMKIEMTWKYIPCNTNCIFGEQILISREILIKINYAEISIGNCFILLYCKIRIYLYLDFRIFFVLFEISKWFLFIYIYISFEDLVNQIFIKCKWKPYFYHYQI